MCRSFTKYIISSKKKHHPQGNDLVNTKTPNSAKYGTHIAHEPYMAIAAFRVEKQDTPKRTLPVSLALGLHD